MIVIVGLGNPGEQYSKTRHNVGFQCVDGLAKRYDIRLGKHTADVLYGEGWVEGKKAVLAKPLTYMNRSGRAVKYLMEHYRSDGAPPELLIVHDDMDLPIGRIRLRRDGSAGGHNGIKSIIAEMGTQDFPRLRIGIGHPAQGDTIGFVLGGFAGSEAKIMAKTVDLAVEAVAWTVEHGLESAMNRYNQVTVTLDG